MADYTKGETAGGWAYILKGEMPIALVHPKHIDKFLASQNMYEALRQAQEGTGDWRGFIDAALAKVDNPSAL